MYIEWITSDELMTNFTGLFAGSAKTGASALASTVVSVERSVPLGPGYSHPHAHCCAVTLISSASTGETRESRYSSRPQKNMIPIRIAGMIDHDSSSGVLCEGLCSMGTPGFRRYLIANKTISPMSRTKKITETQKMKKKTASVPSAKLDSPVKPRHHSLSQAEASVKPCMFVRLFIVRTRS